MGWCRPHQIVGKLQDGCLDCLGYCVDSLDRFARFLGPILVCGAVTMIAANVLYFFLRIAPFYSEPYSVSWTLLTSIGLFAVGNILHNYAVCVSFEPGSAIGMRNAAHMYAVLADTATRAVPLQPPHEMRWCDECSGPKPRRVHHCSVCNTCIMKMDHHCPWVNNCVGVRTYPYFVRLLAWLEFGLWYVVVWGLRPFLAQWGTCNGDAMLPVSTVQARREAVTVGIDPSTPMGWLQYQGAHVHNYIIGTDPWGCPRGFLLTYVLAGTMGLAIAGLFGWHLYLVSTAQTSVEFAKNGDAKRNAWLTGRVYRHDFDSGSMRANWEVVFGTPSAWAWMLPPSWVGVAPTPGLGRAYGGCLCIGRARSGYYRVLGMPLPQDEDDECERVGATGSSAAMAQANGVKQRGKPGTAGQSSVALDSGQP